MCPPNESKPPVRSLRQDDEGYRLLLDRLPIGIAVTNADSILYYNPQALKMLGLEAEDLGRVKPADIYVDPGDRTELLANLDRRGFHEYEIWLRRRDGRPILVRGRSVAIRDQADRIVCYEGYMEDVTARWQAEERQRRSEAKYRALFDDSPDAILVVAPGGGIQAANPSACQLLKQTEATLRQTGMAGILDLDDPRSQMFLEQTDRTAKLQGEMAFRCGDGTRFVGEVSSAGLADEEGREQYHTIIRDITRRKESEQRLRIDLALQRLYNGILQMQSEEDWEQIVVSFQEELHALIDFYACSINIVDLQQDSYTSYFTTAQGLKHLKSAGIRPALRQALETDACVYRRTRAEIARCADAVDPWDERIASVVDVPFVGGTIAINSTREEAFAPQDIAALEKFAWVVSQAYRRLEDLKARTQAEEQLRQSQKMEAVGQLAGGVAHDFNNLLTVINGYCQLLLDVLAQDDSNRIWVEEIQKAGLQASSVTNQLLAFSRRQVQHAAPLNLNTVVKNVEKMLRRLLTDNIELVGGLDPSLGQVLADEGQIQQILLNLVVNARDAMPKGGRLTIETANVQLRETRSPEGGSVKPGRYAMLAVSDTGIGMDAETQKRIFEPFFTTKIAGKGTGLGLAMVYGAVKQSRGYIRVSSRPGEGSVFKVFLPCVDQQAREDSPAAFDAASFRGAEIILLVEDDADVRRVIGRILQKQGYVVLEAGNGKEALQLVQAHNRHIHLLVTDVVMPEMNGRELAETLTALHPETRVLYITGYAEGLIDQDIILEPGTHILQKPIRYETLVQKTREILDRDP
jgi:PAS domain S-box-containing protein